jgi:catechol 2,3-dioxygenase-like lactoylglutathione lyase family enzyme
VLVDRTLEVVVLPVSDIDRSLAFYRDQVGFALDHDTRPRAHARRAADSQRIGLLDRGVECSDMMVFSTDDDGTFFGFSDPDGNSWAVQELKVRGEKALIPVEHRGRFGA